MGKGGRKEGLSDKTRVNTFDFLTRTRKLVFLLLLKFVRCLGDDFSGSIFYKERNNRNTGPALGSTVPQVEVHCVLSDQSYVPAKRDTSGTSNQLPG